MAYWLMFVLGFACGALVMAFFASLAICKYEEKRTLERMNKYDKD